MSMLTKLKETKKSTIFLDDDDDIDNMEFELPDTSASSSSAPSGMPNMTQIGNMMKNMQAAKPGPSAASMDRPSHVSIANTPQGVRHLDPSQYKDWVCVYPCYIDASKSIAEGRKIEKSKAVSDPHAYHMAVAAQMLGLSVVYETKRHPRDWANPGRVKIQLFGPNKQPMRPTIQSRKQLFYALAQRLPELQKTHKKPGNIVGPTTSLAEVEAIVDEQRRAQGLPTLAEMQAQNPMANMPAKPKKQKVKYIRG
ncbi:signal recognition particle, SRP19 subunit [Dichotomocladium elegans]|nr:signal recognition particle, SRP19 subunit [Dichotomocladium elegans]